MVTLDPAEQSLSAVRELVCSIVDQKVQSHHKEQICKVKTFLELYSCGLINIKPTTGSFLVLLSCFLLYLKASTQEEAGKM